MKNKTKKSEEYHPTITEAVERLSSIAEMDFDRNIAMASNEEETIIASSEETALPRSTTWLFEEPERTIEVVQEMFQIVLDYLRKYYKKEYKYLPSHKSLEGVKAIMLLVGEAAKKLDDHKEIFQNSKLKSVTELPEYKHLQEFYLSRIARKIDEGLLSKWILGLSRRLLEQQKKEEEVPPLKIPPTRHLFVDLESVKKDTSYELFFIRKEDGSRFFSPRLIRNIKLVCDFGNRIGELKADDPLESVGIWYDHACQVSAHDIVASVKPLIEKYYHVANETRQWDLSLALSKALMALMMCGNPRNVTHNPTIKSSTDYFIDFQTFLHQALNTREYQKFIAYPPRASQKIERCLLDLTHGLCQGLFMHMNGYQAILPNILKLLEEAQQEDPVAGKHSKKSKTDNHQIDNILHKDYAALTKLFKHHPNGPLVKVLEVLEDGDYQSFDPLVQSNIPCQLFTMNGRTKKIINTRIPCPTHQEYIHKLIVTEEFKGFLRSLNHGHVKGKFLLINLQDRTSWQEHYRSEALEELQNHSELASNLVVVTLAKDTEFYYQTSTYHHDNHADSFIAHFKEQLADENCGFYFPENIKKALFPEFIDNLLHNVHQVFFDGRNILPLQRRLDFIEIVYLFIEMKLIDMLNPDAFSLTCKDGVDIGPAASASLFLFCKWMHNEKLSKEDYEQFFKMVYIPPIMIRERVMHSERFSRLESMFKEIEAKRESLGWEKFAGTVRDQFGVDFYDVHP